MPRRGPSVRPHVSALPRRATAIPACVPRRGRRRRRGHRPRGSRWLRPRRAASPSRLPSATRTYAFHGPHQAGIVTPAQDRMYTAAFDLTTTSRDELLAMLRRWTIMSARLTRGLPAGPTGSTSGPYDAPPEDTGEAMDLPRGGTHHHPRLRPVAVRRHARQARRPVRPGGSSSGRTHRAPAFPRRRHRSCAFGRGHRRPGLRRRPAGRSPCHPEPDPLSVRHGAGPLVAARVRSDIIDLPGAANPAEPVRLQGWDREHHGRGDGRTRSSTSGCKAPTIRPPAGWRVARTWSPGASG